MDNNRLRVLVLGKNGQVGYDLLETAPPAVLAIGFDRSQAELGNIPQLRQVVREVQPQLIINAAAYTAVDKAEDDQTTAELINAVAPGVMGEIAKQLGAAVIHYSTDYVFDGTKTTPYIETDPTLPMGVYGQTKLRGEQTLAATDAVYMILRTSWVYALRGHNFLRTMIRLLQERETLNMVNDQRGVPNWSYYLAKTTWDIVGYCQRISQARNVSLLESIQACRGIYHLSLRGETTWFDFARVIAETMLRTDSARIKPIPTTGYPTRALRPKYSVLLPESLLGNLL